MGILNEIKNDVAAKNIANIRIDLWGCIGNDPNFTQDFIENWNYCLRNGISENELYEIHDNRPMVDEVTNENFSLLCGQLRTNFSKERLDKIREIGRKLFPASEKKTESQTLSTQSSGPRKTNTRSNSNHNNGDAGLLIAGFAIGAIAGGVLGGLIFGKAIAAGVGAIAGTAIGGVIGSTLSKR